MDSLLLNISISANETSPLDAPIIWSATEVLNLLLVLTFTILGLVGNSLVICAWLSYNEISQNPSNSLLLSLAVTDLTISAFAIPFSHIFKLVGRWVFGEASKVLLVLTTQSAVLVSSYHLVLVAVDRYRIAKDGLHYLQQRTVKSVMKPVPWLWFVGIWEITPILIAWPNMDLFSFDRQLGDETTKSVWVTITHPTFVMLHLLVSTLIPVLLLIAIYAKTFKELRKRFRKRVPYAGNPQSSTSAECRTEEGVVTNEDGRVEMESSFGISNGIPSSAQQELQKKKEVLSYERERKTAITLGILILAYLICWVPFLAVNLLYVFGVHAAESVHWMTKFLGMVNSCVNPVIYHFSSQDFNRAFRNIFMKIRKVWRK